MASFVALLRGINVGGKNLIPMPALKSCFEQAGYAEVSTYIQSGNVLFSTTGKKAKIARDVASAIEATFGLDLVVVVRSKSEMLSVVSDAPRGFGQDPEHYKYDVIFLKEPLTAAKAIKEVPLKEGVDQLWAGKGVIYFSRLEAKLTQSRLSKVASLPIYKQMTIRNWNTTTKLAALISS